MFCVSIGFIVNHKPVIGAIYAPLLDQLFSSCLNRGAWLNEKRQLPIIRNPSIPPLPATAPSKCIFACEWGKDRRDIPDGNLARKIESFVNLASERGSRGGKGGMVHGVRSLGSATMDLAYTAMGSVDIWWEGGCWEWLVFYFSLRVRFEYIRRLTFAGMWLLVLQSCLKLGDWSRRRIRPRI